MQFIRQVLAMVARAMQSIASAGRWVKEFGYWVFKQGPRPSFSGVLPTVDAAVRVPAQMWKETKDLAVDFDYHVGLAARGVKTVAKVGLEIATLPVDILVAATGRGRQQQQTDEPTETEEDKARERRKDLRLAMMAQMMRTKSRAMADDWRSRGFQEPPRIDDAPEVNAEETASTFRM